MGRPRKHSSNLPPCVYHRGGKYRLVKNGKWTTLGGEKELAEYVRTLNGQSGKGMVSLVKKGLEAVLSKDLSENTRKQYRQAAKKLEYAFAEFDPPEVRGKHIMALRRGMQKTPNMFNRCLSLLRQVFEYGMNEELVDDNPAMGVKRLPEAKRTRLPSSEEFALIYAKASPRLQCQLDIWRGSGQRVMDVAGLHERQFTDAGIDFTQQKTDARLIVKWTPDLKAAVERARALNGVRSLWLFPVRRGKTKGRPVAYKTVYDDFQRAVEAAGIEDVQLRDWRAVAATTAKRQGINPTALLGHKTPATTVRYLRDKEVPEVEAPSFARVLDIGKK